MKGVEEATWELEEVMRACFPDSTLRMAMPRVVASSLLFLPHFFCMCNPLKRILGTEFPYIVEVVKLAFLSNPSILALFFPKPFFHLSSVL